MRGGDFERPQDAGWRISDVAEFLHRPFKNLRLAFVLSMRRKQRRIGKRNHYSIGDIDMNNMTTIWVLFLILLATVIGCLVTRRRGGTKVRAAEQSQRVEGQEEGGQPYKVFYEYGIAYRVPVYPSDERGAPMTKKE